MSTKYIKVNVSELKEGDTIRVLSRPRGWDSSLNPKNPLNNLTFPHTLKIKKIDVGPFGTSMTCGEYGWSLDSIVGAEYYFDHTFKDSGVYVCSDDRGHYFKRAKGRYYSIIDGGDVHVGLIPFYLNKNDFIDAENTNTQ